MSHLKKLMKKKHVHDLLMGLQVFVEEGFLIKDLEEGVLFQSKEPLLERSQKFFIEYEGENIGSVEGCDKVEVIAKMLSYIASLVLEKKRLAQEVLDAYREINLVYKFSEKVNLNNSIDEIVEMIQQEAMALIPCLGTSVLLLNKDQKKLERISKMGEEVTGSSLIHVSDEKETVIATSIQEHIMETAQADIINDVSEHPFYCEGIDPNSSFICAPLKGAKGVHGILNVMGKGDFVARDKSIAACLALLAGGAIENILLLNKIIDQARIRDGLKRYLPSQLASIIIESKGREEDFFGIKHRDIAFLFSDIRNFTSLCESEEPEVVVNNLNFYFSEMVEIIFKNEGTLNKLVGDMIFALFGAPVSVDNPEKRAVKSAIEMQKQESLTKNSWNREKIKMGIGINTGKAIVGNIGPDVQVDYTAIGDNVNIASRLQAIAGPEEILVTRAVYDKVKDEFQFEKLGDVSLKGLKKTVEVYKVIY